MANAIRSELLKLGRRRMTRVMVLSMLILSIVPALTIVLATGDNIMPGRIRDSFDLVSTLGLVLALVFGASSCGWEFASRTLPSVLAREPNRRTVWVSKLAVLAIISVGFAVVIGIGGLLGLVIASLFVGIKTEPGWVASIVGNWFQALGQASVQLYVTAVFGAALALLLRSTAAAVVVGLGALYVVGSVLEAILGLLWEHSGDYVFTGVLLGFGTMVGRHLSDSGTSLSYGATTGVLIAWVALFVLVGYVALQRQDFS